jgi:two-component system chemotaxis sensor kinase CheA
MSDFGLDQDTVSGFLDEAGLHIATLNERLLAVEQGQVGADAVAEMFRAAHSLKGAAGFLKLTAIATVTHRMESVLDLVRHAKLSFTNQVVDALFQSFDLVTSLLADVAGGGAGKVDTAQVQGLLDAVLAGRPAAAAAPAPAIAVAAPAIAVAAPASAAPLPDAAPPQDDPLEQHLGLLPDWLRGRLDEEDACEALVAAAADEQAVALRFEADELLRFSRGPAAAMAAIATAVRVRRVVHLIAGPEDLWAPLREYRLAIGVFAFCPGDPAAVLRALEVPEGQAWVLKPGAGAPAPLRIGRDPAAAAQRHDRLVIKADMARHLPLWINTTREGLAELDAALLDLEREPAEPAHIDRVFRHLHTAKGGSASMGLDEMARLAHQGENLLAAVRDGRLRLDAEGIAGLFATKDALQACVDRVERGEQDSPDTAAVDGALRRRLASAAGEAGGLPVWQPSEADLAAARAAAHGRQLWKLRLALAAQAKLPDLRYGMILTNLGKVATVVVSRPTLAELERGIPDPPPLCALVASSAPLKELIDAIGCDHIRDWSMDPVAGGEERAAAPAAPGEGRLGNNVAAAADTVRVETARLDHLLNTAGELVITKARLSSQVELIMGLLDGVDVRGLEELVARGGQQAGARLAAGLQALRRAQDESHRTRDTTTELHRHTSAMQNSVMQARMVPIGPLFQRFHRLVRDLCKEQGREARLVIAGEATELDKKLIDEIGDPLTHLIRNGVDHGLEAPDQREAAGKPRQGTIHLEAFHQGGRIRIQVRDDGRGLAVERIRAKAIERGLVTAAACARLTPAEIYQFIFLPGFSTAAQVTNISGRGVGMDIVKSRVTALKGTVDIESLPGQGATFTISLPLTLAMIDSLMVRVGEARFAFPLDSVREIVELDPREVRSVEGKGRVIFLRGQAISLIELSQALGIPARQDGRETICAVITKGSGETLAIAVDQVIGDEEIVVKPLTQEFAQVRGVSGATVLGDGGVALILDIHGILDLDRTRGSRRRAAGARA